MTSFDLKFYITFLCVVNEHLVREYHFVLKLYCKIVLVGYCFSKLCSSTNNICCNDHCFFPFYFAKSPYLPMDPPICILNYLSL